MALAGDVKAQQQQTDGSTSPTDTSGQAKTYHKVVDKISSLVCEGTLICPIMRSVYRAREVAALDKLAKDTAALSDHCYSQQCQMVVRENFQYIQKQSALLHVPMAADLLQIVNHVPDPAATGLDKAVGAGAGIATDKLKEVTQP